MASKTPKRPGRPGAARRGGGDAGSPERTALAWLLLCVPAPLFLLSTAAPGTALSTAEVLLTVLLTAYSGTHLAVRFGRGDLRIAATTFWLFVYAAMSVASLARISTGLHSYLADPATLTEAILITLVGCVAYDAAQVAHRLVAHRLVARGKDLAPAVRSIDFGRLNAIGVVGVAASAYYIQSVGLSSFFSSRTDLAQGLTQAGLATNGSQTIPAIVGALAVVPLLVAWLGWTARMSRDPAARRSPSRWAWYLILSTFVVILNNPISTSRYQFLTIALAAIFCLPNLGKRAIRFAIAGGVVLAITVFPYSDYFRVQAADRQPLQVNSIAVELATKDYDQVTMIANGIWYADVFGHTDGSQLLSDVLFFVPHSVWPGRSTDTGVLIGQAMRDPNVNLSAPMWVEFWLDFSWGGLITGFLLFGWITARWDDLFVHLRRRRYASPAVLDIALPLFAGYQFILLRGSILQAIGRMVVVAILLVVIRGRLLNDEGPHFIAAAKATVAGSPYAVGPRTHSLE